MAAYKYCMQLCDDLADADKLVASTKKAALSWESKLKVAEKKVTDLTAAVRVKDEQLKAKDDQITNVTKEVEEARGELASKTTEMEGLMSLHDASQEEFKDCELLAVMRTRAQMMYSHLIGETSIWSCQKEADDYLACGGTMEELAVPVVDVGKEVVDTTGTEAAEENVNQPALDVHVTPAVHEEGEAPVDAPQEETLEKETTEVVTTVDTIVPPLHID